MDSKKTLTVFGTLIVSALVLVLLAGCASRRLYRYNPATGEVIVDIRGTDAKVGQIDLELDPQTGGVKLHIENMSQSDRMIEASKSWAEATGKLIEKLPVP